MPGSQGVSSPHRRTAAKIPQSEGAGEEVTGAIAGASCNVGINWIVDTQTFREPLRRPRILSETRGSQPDELDEPLPKRLDGKVTKKGVLAFAGGTYCEVWVGLWDKGGEEAGRERADPEKVGLILTTLTPLISPHRWP